MNIRQKREVRYFQCVPQVTLCKARNVVIKDCLDPVNENPGNLKIWRLETEEKVEELVVKLLFCRAIVFSPFIKGPFKLLHAALGQR